ncbi:MAG: hypothetical protein ACRD44_04045 [Bryobacteraceae bacterium]
MTYAHLGAYYRLKGDMLATRGPGGALQMNDRARRFYLKSAEVLRRGVHIDRALREARRQQELALASAATRSSHTGTAMSTITWRSPA